MAEDLNVLKVRVDGAQASAALTALGKIDAFEKSVEGGRKAGQALADARQKVKDLQAAMQQQAAGSPGFVALSKQAEAAERNVQRLYNRFKTVSAGINAQGLALQAGGIDPAKLAATRAGLEQIVRTQNARVTLKLDGLDRARAEILRVREALAQLKASGTASMSEIRQATRNANAEIRRLEAQIAAAGGGFGGLVARARSSGGALGLVFSPITLGIAALTAGVRGLDAAIGQSKQFEALDAKLLAVFGNTRAAGEAFDFSRATANRLGIELGLTASQYANLAAATKGTNLEGQKTRDIFSAVTESGARLKLTAEQITGALTAVQQIASKGTVSAEELRGQLSERIPGAFQIAARAMSVTTAELGKLLEQGALASDVFLPKFAAELRRTYGTDVNTRVDGLAASQARLTAQIELTADAVGDKLAPALKRGTDAFAELVQFARDNPIEFVVRAVGAAGTLPGAIAEQAKQREAAEAIQRNFKPSLTRGATANRGGRNIPRDRNGNAVARDGFAGGVDFALPELERVTKVPESDGASFADQFKKGAEAASKLTLENREQLALLKLQTEEQKTLYKITVGSLKDRTNEEKNSALELARQQDKVNAARKQPGLTSAANKDALAGQRNQIKQITAELRKANAELDLSFARGDIDGNAYIDARAKLAADAIAAQREAVQQALAKGGIGEDVKARLQQDLSDLEDQAAESAARTAEDRMQLAQRGSDAVLQLTVARLRAEGKEDAAAKVELEGAYKDHLRELRQAGVANAEQMATDLKNAQLKAIESDDIARALDKAQTRFTQRRDTIDAQVQVGDLSGDQGRARLRDAQREYLEVVHAIQQRIEAAPDLLPPERLEELRAQLATVQADLGTLFDTPAKQLLKSWSDTTDAIEQVGVDALRGMADAITDLAVSGKADFKSLADLIIRELIRIQVQKALAFAAGSAGGSALGGFFGSALGFVGSLFGGAAAPTGNFNFGTGSGSVAAASGLNTDFVLPLPIRKAGGGAVRGPGSSTSDSIPAMLSNGEFVLRAAAVKRIGIARLNRLNEGRFVMPARFANGGLVGRSPASLAPASNNVTVSISQDLRGATDPAVLVRAGQAIKADVLRTVAEQMARGTGGF